MWSEGQARALMRLVEGSIETGMKERSKSMPHVGSRLFAAYAAASLVPVVLLGAVLVRGSQREALESGREQGRAQAAVIEEMAIAPALTGADLDHQLTTAERQRLQDATDLAIFHGSVIRLRLRGFRGRVVFSDNGSTAGALPTSHHAFQAAAVGRTDVAIVQDPDGAPSQVIRVLQPVVAKATGQATGVLELYLPYSTIAKHVQAQMRRTYWRLAAGLTALYAVLAFIAWSTTRRLRRHATQHQHEALHDALTGLPNRKWFREQAEEAVERGQRGAIVLVDLDRFKDVNDTLGHQAGDELLGVVAQRLPASLRTDDTVARLGGDEFGLILPGIPDAAHALELLARVREELAAQIVLDTVPLSIEASFGVALYPTHGTTVEVLLQHADAAMYQGKRGTSGVVVYEPATVAHPTQWLIVQGELRRALEHHELVLHYQPKVELASGQICGIEALVRWDHPQRGLLPPAEFLPAVEQSSLIDPLTAWVLRRALTDHASWTARGMPWPVAVNVSARNLEVEAFPESVAELLDELRVPANQLHLEITETALAADAVAAAQAVTALAGQGIAISLDDFGMGYTSLSQLRTLPIAELKIHQSFVMDLGRDERDRAIVRSLIGLAAGLGCRLTAEGVETPAVAIWLAAAGCEYAQGYLFSKPLPYDELLNRFRRHADAANVHDEQPQTTLEGTWT
jgi:diguanylate cyclase (GGDEF)-like protein